MSMMGSEARRFNPEASQPEREDERTRGLLEGRWLTHGDADVEGVPDEAKAKFVADKLRETDAQLAKLMKQAKQLEALREKYSGAAPEADFEPQDKAWFAEGEDAEHLALQANWETSQSLDVDDISDTKKYQFAKRKREELSNAFAAGQVADAEAAKERLDRLELLEDQYKKGADAEKDLPN